MAYVDATPPPVYSVELQPGQAVEARPQVQVLWKDGRQWSYNHWHKINQSLKNESDFKFGLYTTLGFIGVMGTSVMWTLTPFIATIALFILAGINSGYCEVSMEQLERGAKDSCDRLVQQAPASLDEATIASLEKQGIISNQIATEMRGFREEYDKFAQMGNTRNSAKYVDQIIEYRTGTLAEWREFMNKVVKPALPFATP